MDIWKLMIFLVFVVILGNTAYKSGYFATPTYGDTSPIDNSHLVVAKSANNTTILSSTGSNATPLLSLSSNRTSQLKPSAELAAPGQLSPCAGGFPCSTAWDINANGFYGRLLLDSVDKSGKFHGTLFDHPINGTWNQYSKNITFEEINPSTNQSLANYSGYLYDMCGAHHRDFTDCYILAGSFVINGLKEESRWAAIIKGTVFG